MRFTKKLFSNTRKPQGILGKMMLCSMNQGHAKMADWGMAQMPSLSPKTIVDLGCGGGRHDGKLMEKYPSARLTAVDYSEVSVAATKKRNKAAVEAGKCRVLQGDVSKLTLPNGAFDLATAFETVYFWPGPVQSFREVFRILKSGGYFLMVNESDGTDPADQKWVDQIDGMHIYPEAELCDHLKEAGFGEITVRHRGKWICFLAKKD